MMKPDRDGVIRDAFDASSLKVIMTNRTAILGNALEAMRTALQWLDEIEAYAAAARLQHAIDVVERDIALSDETGVGSA